MATSAVLPNSAAALEQRAADHRLTWGGPVLMLFARTLLFIGVQALFALAFLVAGQPAPWEAAAAWWPISVTVSNAVTLGLLSVLLHREGLRLRDLYRVERHVVWREILIVVGLMVIGGPVAMLPNIILGNAIFGDVALTLDMMFRPLPQWAIMLALLFPLTVALAELPTYFAYAMPRLEALTGRTWLAILLPALFLGLQHIGIPFLLDGRYLLWRSLMLLPFAIFAGIVLRWRPRLLPYMMVVHGLMDLQLILMIPAA